MPNRLAADLAVPAPARRQPGRLVAVGGRGVRGGAAPGRAGAAERRVSACHWCHVMAHESFEDDATAAYLNEHFVASRSTARSGPTSTPSTWRPCRRATGQGGWPMTVFLTPDGRALLLRHVLPARPAPRHAVLPAGAGGCRAAAWTDRRDEVAEVAGKIVRDLAGREICRTATADAPGEESSRRRCSGSPGSTTPRAAASAGRPSSRRRWCSSSCCATHARTGAEGALQMAQDTCERMARGGIYDQLGGGFARYSVDREWVVPHFEKMLYDNALLCRVYAHLWRATGSELARRVALETADFMVRELRTNEGGFASALDADSDDGDRQARRGRLLRLDARAAAARCSGRRTPSSPTQYFGVTEEGTFEEGSSVLQLPQHDGLFDAERIASVGERLLRSGRERSAPGRDDKVVAAWNGLAIAALAETGAYFDRPDLVDAPRGRRTLLDRSTWTTAAAARATRDGAGRPGRVLEDYADVAEGFLALLGSRGRRWLSRRVPARPRPRPVRRRVRGLYDTAATAERAADPPAAGPDRQRHAVRLDGGGGRAALLRRAHRLRAPSDRRRAGARRVRRSAARARFIGWGLAIAEALLDGPREVAVVGRPGDPATGRCTGRRCSAPRRGCGGRGRTGQRRSPAAGRPAAGRRPPRVRLPSLHL